MLTCFYLFQFTCGHFKKCNEWLAERYGEDGRIDWSLTSNTTTLVPTAAAAEKDMSDTGNGQKDGISFQSSPGTSKINDQEASKTADDNDPLSDKDDIEALEALLTAEESLKSEHDDSLGKPRKTGPESEKK